MVTGIVSAKTIFPLVTLLLMAYLLLITDAAVAQSISAKPDSQPDAPEIKEAEKIEEEAQELYRQKNFDEAFKRADQALKLREKVLGKDKISLAPMLISFGQIASEMGNYAKGESLLLQALQMEEKRVGDAAHLDLLKPLNALSAFYQHEANRNKTLENRALPIYERITSIEEKNYGVNSKALIHTLQTHACALHQAERPLEAQPYEQRAHELNMNGIASPKSLKLSDDLVTGHAIQRIAPKYPKEAKKHHIQGAVMVAITISTTGKVTTAEAYCGHPSLTEAAVEAARKWEFQPTELKGVPVNVQGFLTFNFTLQ